MYVVEESKASRNEYEKYADLSISTFCVTDFQHGNLTTTRKFSGLFGAEIFFFRRLFKNRQFSLAAATQQPFNLMKL